MRTTTGAVLAAMASLAVAACSSPQNAAPSPATSTVTVTAGAPAPSPSPSPVLRAQCAVEHYSSGPDAKITLWNDSAEVVYVSEVNSYLFDSSGNVIDHLEDTQFPGAAGQTVEELAVKADSGVWYREPLYAGAAATSCRVIAWQADFAP